MVDVEVVGMVISRDAGMLINIQESLLASSRYHCVGPVPFVAVYIFAEFRGYKSVTHFVSTGRVP